MYFWRSILYWVSLVWRTLSRKFTSFRRKRKREDARHEDCDPNTSAIKTNVCLSEQSKLKVIACKSGKNENSSCNNSVTGTNCTGGKSLSRIFGSFRQSFRQVKNGDELEDNCKVQWFKRDFRDTGNLDWLIPVVDLSCYSEQFLI